MRDQRRKNERVGDTGLVGKEGGIKRRKGDKLEVT